MIEIFNMISHFWKKNPIWEFFFFDLDNFLILNIKIKLILNKINIKLMMSIFMYIFSI